jgi:hypothetical protein
MATFESIEEVTDRHLHIIWTSPDPLVAGEMVLMYSKNAMLNHWWDRVTVVAWGASQKLLLEDETVYEKVKIAQLAGVEFSSCISCAIDLGTLDELTKRGIESIRWGQKLSLLLQNGKHVLTV